jgi:hypothetical protein
LETASAGLLQDVKPLGAEKIVPALLVAAL